MEGSLTRSIREREMTFWKVMTNELVEERLRCTQRSLYKNKRYLKHKRNRKYKDIQYKFTYKQQQEREQTPDEVSKRKSRKRKDQQAGMKILPNTAHQPRGAE